jgi:hypothetical protein
LEKLPGAKNFSQVIWRNLRSPTGGLLTNVDHPPRDEVEQLAVTLCIAHLTLWLFNIAMENGPFIDGLAIKNGDFPWLC